MREKSFRVTCPDHRYYIYNKTTKMTRTINGLPIGGLICCIKYIESDGSLLLVDYRNGHIHDIDGEDVQGKHLNLWKYSLFVNNKNNNDAQKWTRIGTVQLNRNDAYHGFRNGIMTYNQEHLIVFDDLDYVYLINMENYELVKKLKITLSMLMDNPHDKYSMEYLRYHYFTSRGVNEELILYGYVRNECPWTELTKKFKKQILPKDIMGVLSSFYVTCKFSKEETLHLIESHSSAHFTMSLSRLFE